MSEEGYQSPLGTRYASPAMQILWGEPRRIGLWRRLWLALAESQRELGLPIPEQALVEMRAHLDDADLAVAARYERRFRHDVMAHIHAFGDQAPPARPYLHLGATSAFVTDNADLVIMREGLRLLLGRLLAVLARAGDLRLAGTRRFPAWRTPISSRPSSPPSASAPRSGCRTSRLDVEEICHRIETLRFRGCKGTTGTQARFLELFARRPRQGAGARPAGHRASSASATRSR